MSLLINSQAGQATGGLLQRKGSRVVSSNLTFAAPCPVSLPSCSGRGEPTAFTARRSAVGLSRGALQTTRATSGSEDGQTPGVVYNKEFGYSRKDIILIGGGLIALGYAMYYGLIATGMEPGFAGNWVQMIIFLGICVGWISTYLFRVATKQMTYVKQLEAYEEAVMKKRVEEMTEEELAQLVKEAEAEKQRAAARAAQMQGNQQQQQQP